MNSWPKKRKRSIVLAASKYTSVNKKHYVLGDLCRQKQNKEKGTLPIPKDLKSKGNKRYWGKKI